MHKIDLRHRLALEIARQQHKDLNRRHPLRQLFWECTQRCNLRCRHCGSDCKTSSETPDMPAEDFLRALDDLIPHVDTRRLNIVITGGEPLMRADLEEIGLQLYRRRLPWGIVSNGLALTPARFDSLKAAGIHNLTISLDGLENDHNTMRGNPASFRRACDAIALAAKDPDISFDVVTCVTRNSLPTLPQIHDLLLSLGVREWRLFTIFPSGRARNCPEFNLTSGEFISLLDFIRETRKKATIRCSFACEGFLGNYEGEVRDHFFTCQAGISIASVLIDGSIGACPSIRADFAQGNIYDGDSIWDVWENRFQIYRDHSWMKTGICADCKAFRYCEGNGMHLRESDGSIKHCHFHQAACKS